MKKGLALYAAVLLALGTFAGIMNFGSMNAQGTNVSGIISADITWDLAGSPWIVIGDVTVAVGATLTIDPGVDVKFDGFYSIYVDGNLTAIGTQTSRITITSNSATPMPGSWDRIQINSTGQVAIEYSSVNYGYFGIRLESASNNIIANNSISNNTGGIHLEASLNNTIVGNVMLSNTGGGIVSWFSSNNTISNNDIINNRDGIFLASSLNNWIYHNNFIYNTNQARDNTDGNFWNDTYPSGGNYWSDHSPTCTDNFNGTVTPQTGGSPDDICDNQYNIDIDSIDYYPLKNRVGDLPSIVIVGAIDIANPLPDAQITLGTTIFVDGWANSTQTSSGHLQDITIVIRLIDSGGSVVQQKLGTTNLTGYFSIEFPIPEYLEPGSYDICATTDFGNVTAACVPIALAGIEKGIPLWLIVLIIIIVIAASGIIATLLIKKKKKPSEFAPSKTDIPTPPPPAQPPPP